MDLISDIIPSYVPSPKPVALESISTQLPSSIQNYVITQIFQQRIWPWSWRKKKGKNEEKKKILTLEAEIWANLLVH